VSTGASLKSSSPEACAGVMVIEGGGELGQSVEIQSCELVEGKMA
jgi:hypothetical protein